MIRRNTIFVVLFTALALAVASVPAFGAKGGAGGSSITLQLLSTSASTTTATAAPHFADTATYSVSTPQTSQPWENTRCYQGSTLVFDDWRGLFKSYVLSQSFTFGPTGLWSGGAASCVARLVSFDNGKERTLATTSFDVSA
jgi:hypothetical protein